LTARRFERSSRRQRGFSQTRDVLSYTVDDAMATSDTEQWADQAAEGWRYLRVKPGNWRRQLWLTGRNMTVGQLVYSMRAEGMLDDPEAAAVDFELPVEQVREALEYYRRHRDLIEADADEEKRWLIEQGFDLEPRRR
jgi:uncharacterized protein (DUF433 family)